MLIIVMMCCRTLKHPNIVELMAYAKSEEEIVLVTNFVDGSNLDTILFGKKRLEREVHNIIIILLCSHDIVWFLLMFYAVN